MLGIAGAQPNLRTAQYGHSCEKMSSLMPIEISKSEFKARLLELFHQVETSGEPLVVSNRGRPVPEVRPYRAPDADPLDLLRGTVMLYEKPTEPTATEGWEGSAM